MRVLAPTLCGIALCLSTVALSAQAPAPAPATSTAPAAPTTPSSPSSLVQPALDAVYQTVGSLKTEKWKGGSVRGEAISNINSIRHDLDSTLPDLLKEADANPTSASKMIPALRNINALYDVVLRVFEASRVVASSEQAGQLQVATENLEKARRALTDRVQDTAAAQEKQVVTLQASLRSQPAPVCPVVQPPAPPPPTPAKKTVHRRAKPAAKPDAKPAAKPAPGSPATQPATKPQN